MSLHLLIEQELSMQILAIWRLQAWINELLWNDQPLFITHSVRRYHFAFSFYALDVFNQIVICKEARKKQKKLNQLLRNDLFTTLKIFIVMSYNLNTFFFHRQMLWIHKQCFGLIMLDSRNLRLISLNSNQHHLWMVLREFFWWHIHCGSKIFIFSLIDRDGFFTYP